MKPPTLRIIVSVCIFLLYLSCNKSDNNPNNKHYTPEIVTASLSGRVTDDANKPVPGALVKAGDASATTNIDGAFTINDVSIDKNAAFVKVVKDGYFLGTKTIVANANKNNPVTIQLIPKTLAGNISSTSGGSVTIPLNGGTIDFQANSFVNPNGNTSYTGTVAVSAFFINPESADFNNIMPGTLRGINTDNQETGLQSFGMMAVELTGNAGEKLQLASGKTAKLHFPIPASLQGEAPASIPLWSLDETAGLWKQEGNATRQDNEYIGIVSHFSFWNCDAPFPVIDLKGTIRNEQGNNLAGMEVVISVPADGNSSSSIAGNGLTNEDGDFSGKVPANKTLQFKIYNKCHTLLHTQNFGPFTSTTDVGVITVDASVAQVTISGTVKNCFNAAVPSGFVSMKLENIYYNIPVTNGSFSTTITRCSNETATATLVAYDQSQQSSGQEVSIAVAGSSVDAGTLVACGATVDTYIRYTLDGVSYQILPTTDTVRHFVSSSISGNMTMIEGKRAGQPFEELAIFFKGPEAPGSYPLFLCNFYFGAESIQYFKTGDFIVNVTEYGTDPGSYVAGTFACTVRNSDGTKFLPVTCSFRVKRQ
jgi:hypothetical protein